MQSFFIVCVFVVFVSDVKLTQAFIRGPDRVLCNELLFGYRTDFLHGDDSMDKRDMPK